MLFLKDRYEISSRRITDEGYLIVDAVIARTGVQDYYAFELGLDSVDPTSKVSVYRPQSEVFNEDSMNSFKNKPITDDHPPVLIDSSNVREFQRGVTLENVRQDGDYLKITAQITDKELIDKIDSGKTELSNGYTLKLDWAEGFTPDGKKYDAIQRKIKGNHVAVVDKGRCGAVCSISDSEKPNSKGYDMNKITIDGVEYEVSDQVSQAVGKLQLRLNDVEAKANSISTTTADAVGKVKVEMQSAVDSLTAERDGLKDKIPTPAQLDALVIARQDTVDGAKMIDPDVKWEGNDCETIRSTIVSQTCKDVDVGVASKDYIRARFDGLVADKKAGGSSSMRDALNGGINPKKEEDEEEKDPVKEAREKKAEDSRNAWNKGGDK